MDKLIEQIKKARFIGIIGNGGSASTAEHFTTDLVKKKYPAICLNSNISVITMIANDYGYKSIFGRQLSVYGSKEDLLITISCSGESENIVSAIEWAKNYMSIYQFETFGKETNYGKLEDKHLKFAHEVASRL
mgnify:CR=1 FL=1